MIDLLKKLCAPIGVSGDEGRVRDVILKEIEPYCDEISVDNGGNIIATKKGKIPPNKKIMIAAHMDEVGFIITSVTDSGLLCFDAVGGIDERLYIGKRVVICSESEVYGVIGSVPPHLLSSDSKTAVLKENQLYINIGAKNKKEALSRVSLGDTGTLIGDFTPFGDGRLMARALDDRCGCAILISLLKSEAPVDFTAVFTVQEEIGCRGAMMASFSVCPDVAIVLDSTTACDIQDVAPEKTVCNLKEGGVVSFMDRGCAYDREFFSLIMKTAKENNIPAQVKRAVAGANDSASICKSAGGVKTAAISMPCRYLHTPNCVIDISDMDCVYNLVHKILEKAEQL